MFCPRESLQHSRDIEILLNPPPLTAVNHPGRGREVEINTLNRQFDPLSSDAPVPVAGMMAKLTSMTTGIFGGNTTFKESFDPEYPADKYLELTVRTKLAPEQIVLAETEWIKAMAEIAPAWGDLRLKIVPV